MMVEVVDVVETAKGERFLMDGVGRVFARSLLVDWLERGSNTVARTRNSNPNSTSRPRGVKA